MSLRYPIENRPAARRAVRIVAALFCLFSFTLAARTASAAIFGVPNGATDPNGWFLLDGTASLNADGDTVHRMFFKIEVTGTTLNIQVFDAGNSGARDLTAAPRTATNTTYTLRDPSGTVLATNTIGNDTGGGTTTDNNLRCFSTTGVFRAIGDARCPFTVQPGLYEFQVTMGAGTEVNAFGLSIPNYQVYSSTDTSPNNPENGQIVDGALNTSDGGTPPALVANITQPTIMYPYVDRGCQLTTTNFDMDAVGGGAGAGSSGTLLSRLSTSTTLTMSSSTVAVDDAITFITAATQAQDYGIYRLDNNTGTQQNLIDWRVADYTGVTTPGAQLPHNPNAPLRIYLPADGSLPGAPVAPVEPRLEQSLTPLGGADPPAVGSTSYVEVNVLLTNPTASAMTSVTVTANVPGGQVLYDSWNPPLIIGGAQVTGRPVWHGSGGGPHRSRRTGVRATWWRPGPR